MLSQAALFNILAVLYIFLIQIRHSKNTNIDYNCYPRKVCASQRGVWLRALLVGVESDSAAECSRLFWSNLRCVCQRRVLYFTNISANTNLFAKPFFGLLITIQERKTKSETSRDTDPLAKQANWKLVYSFSFLKFSDYSYSTWEIQKQKCSL